MQENEDKINELLAKIDMLSRKQDKFLVEINKLKVEVHKYKKSSSATQEGTIAEGQEDITDKEIYRSDDLIENEELTKLEV
jgi:hypothetical protein